MCICVINTKYAILFPNSYLEHTLWLFTLKSAAFMPFVHL